MKNKLIGNVDFEAWKVEDTGEEEMENEYSLRKWKPENSKFKLYIDFDKNFIVIYPVLHIENRTYLLSNYKDEGNSRIEVFMSYFSTKYRTFKIRQSLNFPELLTLPVIYTDDILDFFLVVIPDFLKIAEVYYTENLKKVMIKKNIKFNISSNGGSIEEYLFCDFDFDISPDDLEEMINSYKSKEEMRFYQLKSGGFVDLRAEKVAKTLEFLRKFGITKKDLEKRKIAIPKQELLYTSNLIEKAKEDNAIELSGIDLSNVEESMFNISDVNFDIPKSINAQLRNYQKEGYRWMKKLFHMGLGGILADDMGLGKTLQTIALIASSIEQNENLKCLIIVPTSLIDNWMSEFEKFAPDIKCTSIVGEVLEREKRLREYKSYNVMITSYGLVLNDIKNYRRKKFDIIILDEAQKIKNHLSKTSTEIKSIKGNVKFALTGTPIENNLYELWSIFNWTMPPLLKDFKAFKSKYIGSNENLEELKERVSPFILRRIKKDVLEDLPEKTETTIKVELTDTQKKLYLGYRNKAIELIEEGSKLFDILPQLTRLRQICCHPGMFLEDYSDKSIKTDVLMDILNQLKEENRRALVFSQFTSMLDIIKAQLEKENIKYEMLDGRTPQKKRDGIIKRFNNDDSTAFLISLKAGGTGLNLTSADTVIHFDPWWNPSVEEQASARAHRIGQKKKVQVIYLIAKGTIEERINDVKQNKKELIDKIIEPTSQTISDITVEEVKKLLVWD
ncbi:SNF2-related protein [Herbivorax sp. ANBcel31]|uniref:DEAD/DEAH box helicase n=1 Tax=Herbivorax sp. ANBcel31 TaxID=3069754 RepID=UPI0027AFDF6C|nr:DEAD/DEAH box helicase [Herbivorax sp. ANBcel31]MDQ2085080.1 SNF2-related protein [Herbivorax sp. ANBcel31]